MGTLSRGNEGRWKELGSGRAYGPFRNRKTVSVEYANVQDGTVELGKFNSEHILRTYYVLGTALDARMH